MTSSMLHARPGVQEKKLKRARSKQAHFFGLHAVRRGDKMRVPRGVGFGLRSQEAIRSVMGRSLARTSGHKRHNQPHMHHAKHDLTVASPLNACSLGCIQKADLHHVLQNNKKSCQRASYHTNKTEQMHTNRNTGLA